MGLLKNKIREVAHVRQREGEPARRWFTDDFFDLIVWQGDDGQVLAFQLGYDKRGYERIVSWDRVKGYGHNRVDDGESQPGRLKSSPILVLDGIFDVSDIARQFEARSTEMEKDLAQFVLQKILAFPAQGK